GVPTHAVGDREQPLLGDGRVLVVGAHFAGIARRGPVEAQAVRHASTSNTVAPTLMRSPRLTGMAPSTLRPLTYVPLVEPRSSTCSAPSRWKSRACSCDA